MRARRHETAERRRGRPPRGARARGGHAFARRRGGSGLLSPGRGAGMPAGRSTGRPAASTVHPTAVIGPNVRLGAGSVVGEYVVLGREPRGRREGELELVIGAGAVIRPFTTIYAGTRIGARLQTGQGASIREDNVIGDDVSVGTHASLEFGNRIGSRVRVHTGCFLELTQIDDDVFLGPHVVFTDDPHPQCPAYLDCVKGGGVRRPARLGGRKTTLPRGETSRERAPGGRGPAR